MTDAQRAPRPPRPTPERVVAQQAARPHRGNVVDRAADLRKHRSAADVPPGHRQVGGTKAVTRPGHAERPRTPRDGTRRRQYRPYGGTR